MRAASASKRSLTTIAIEVMSARGDEGEAAVVQLADGDLVRLEQRVGKLAATFLHGGRAFAGRDQDYHKDGILPWNGHAMRHLMTCRACRSSAAPPAIPALPLSPMPAFRNALSESFALPFSPFARSRHGRSCNPSSAFPTSRPWIRRAMR